MDEERARRIAAVKAKYRRTVHLIPTFRLRRDASWASYQNTVEEPGQTFNLGLNRLMYRAIMREKL